MKRLLYFLLPVFILVSCVSSQRHLENGHYDAAIDKAIKKIKRKKTNNKQIAILEKAYNKANATDLERIAFLKKEGTPENWDNIFDHYSLMNRRQNKIKPLLPLKNASFELVNYDEEIINAKQKAADYFYTHALTLLQKGDKENARKAYYELQQVKKYYSNFKDIDEYLHKARALGTSYVLFKMQNKTGVPLPPGFEEELCKISLSDLNRDWLIYHERKTEQLVYDYTILVNMKMIDVSPESIKSIHYSESKEVPDGWQYELDAKGNVKKDSAGNDIKKPKFKRISCSVMETFQNKKAIISGSLDYINNYNGQLIKTDPITAESFFEHRSATAIGDLDALKPDTKKKINNVPVPFPHDFDMLLNAGNTLKGMVKGIIWNNKHVLY